MTDARFPDRWLSDRRIQRLSDSHFRAFMTSLTWSVTNRTDGVIHPEDLALIPNFGSGAPQAFVDAGLWSPEDTGWVITDFIATQTSREQLAANERQRAKEREKKARQRAAAKSATSNNTSVPGDIPGDVTRENPGQDRTGKDRHVVEAVEVPKNGHGVQQLKPVTVLVPVHCRYCDNKIEPHLQYQKARGYCDSPECKAEAKAELS